MTLCHHVELAAAIKAGLLPRHSAAPMDLAWSFCLLWCIAIPNPAHAQEVLLQLGMQIASCVNVCTGRKVCLTVYTKGAPHQHAGFRMVRVLLGCS